MTDYQCICVITHEFKVTNGCILHDPKLKGSLLICQRLDKLIECLTTKA